ncbi:heparan-alpha-glucosaminide N-acetyltransferase domain-containing protein [Tamlana sp. 2_MG-2023]|uniref:heparan-alpha-glucosaminide N-acetyltransferase domain-containing protein n=1 Tax=unclassified Tamlana TaxID=2614803 RepID=UPI0026E30450|nr:MULTISPECIES: heparan-alpha-glucosaminide N-acetyltransferase domain-containing protein [unclassified Tamlana]MDO6759232.1 heparan-alpha-glucosaminide N-acetyltransferase domain-containing protein [Tamlana sp. 2_MG-2023]MDO6790629.1 heparan-alpha-glucosaminide N-acetyltransferase domain-containing protein [Tamlana sp. 1_MG-2023]
MQTNRLYFIDAVRAFAILMMLQGHFIDTLLDPIYRDSNNIFYNIWSYFRGVTAPMFFTISGLVFTYLMLRAYAKGNDRPRIKKGVFRGLLLIFIGYSLRANIFSWFKGYFNPYFLVIDVLQCIGLSLILLVGLHVILKKHSYIFSIVLFVIGCAIFISEPLYRELTLENVPRFFANYMTKSNGSVFTILPWFGYSAFGAFLSTIFFRHLHKKRFRQLTIFAFLTTGIFLVFGSTSFLLRLYDLTGITLLERCANFNYLFGRLGDVLIIFSIFYSLEPLLKQSIISKIGEKTLSIYVIHFILLYGSFTGYGLKRYLNQSLNPTEAIIGALLFMVVVCFISFHYAKPNAFVYKLVRKTTDKLKN